MKSISESRLVQQLKEYYIDSHYLITTEFSIGYGRADLVAFKINPNKCRARLENGQQLSLDRVEYYTLLHLMPDINSGNNVSISYLSDKLCLSSSYLKNHFLKHLIKSGYIVEVEQKKYVKVNGFIPIADEIIAIEVKISDWKKGAIQAKRYQVFANRTFLALYSNFVHRADLSLLKKHNIGLMSVNNAEIHEVLPVYFQKPKDEIRFSYASEWVWKYRRSTIRNIFNNES